MDITGAKSPPDTLSVSERPIFLLSSGHRCGSTLIQRLLNSHDDILIWGEQRGYLNTYESAHMVLVEAAEASSGNRKKFLQEGYDHFLPNLLPAKREVIDAARLHIQSLFAAPAQRLGRSVWGFKEVRYGAKIALFLQRHFPEARFIHLTRNVVDCLISLKKWEQSKTVEWNADWTPSSLASWERVNRSFHDQGHELKKLLSVTYEEVVADTDRFLETLAAFLEIPSSSLDRRVFERKLHSAGDSGEERRPEVTVQSLGPEERALLDRPELVETAALYGYDLQEARPKIGAAEQ